MRNKLRKNFFRQRLFGSFFFYSHVECSVDIFYALLSDYTCLQFWLLGFFIH